MYEEGFNAFFENKRYSESQNAEWLNGWTKAERESRCGWFLQNGEPNANVNKA